MDPSGRDGAKSRWSRPVNITLGVAWLLWVLQLASNAAFTNECVREGRGFYYDDSSWTAACFSGLRFPWLGTFYLLQLLLPMSFAAARSRLENRKAWAPFVAIAAFIFLYSITAGMSSLENLVSSGIPTSWRLLFATCILLAVTCGVLTFMLGSEQRTPDDGNLRPQRPQMVALYFLLAVMCVMWAIALAGLSTDAGSCGKYYQPAVADCMNQYRFAWITTFLALFLLVALVVVAVRAGGSGLLVWRTAWITMLALCAGMYMVSLYEVFGWHRGFNRQSDGRASSMEIFNFFGVTNVGWRLVLAGLGFMVLAATSAALLLVDMEPERGHQQWSGQQYAQPQPHMAPAYAMHGDNAAAGRDSQRYGVQPAAAADLHMYQGGMKV